MAGERVMWLVMKDGEFVGRAYVYEDVARFVLRDYQRTETGWRCSQITVKEADGE